MADDCSALLAVDNNGKSETSIQGIYLGAVIIITCAACVTPLELFVMQMWDRHGFSSLLFFFLPLIAGSLVAGSLPERYYRVKPFESSGLVYERVGIRFFKRFVPGGDYINRIIRRSVPGYRVVYDEASVAEFEARTRLAERCHIIGIVLALPSVAYALILGWDGFALWLLLPNIPLHFYPVMLQRYTRARIQRVRCRGERKRLGGR
jgi:hypothetical protein